MKRLLIVLVSLLSTQLCSAQDGLRYGILPNPDLYKQKTPKDALGSVILAIERDRLDYLAAHLMPKDYIDARLQKTVVYFEKIAAEQLSGTAQGQNLKGAALQARVRERGELLNFKNLTETMSRKLADEPDTIRNLKKFLREGELNEAGDTATITHKEVKDRVISLRKIEGLWFFENRREEPAKE